MSIRDNIESVNRVKAEAAIMSGRNPEDVLLVAVTKLHSPEEINEAIDQGITDIGENKVQEILEKYDRVKPVRWHLIGHLQTNKVKYIIDKVDMIHSVDSLKLAGEIEKRASAAGLTMDILIQVSPVNEESKFGVPMEEVRTLAHEISGSCPHINIKGLMAIAPLLMNPEETRPIFKAVKELYDDMSTEFDFKYLSMGMTGDYEIAVQEGSNLIRVGTAIFGNRDYRSEER